MNSKPYFIQIVSQSKSSDDYRSFLQFANREEMMVYEIRGYGPTPVEATADVWKKFNDEDPYFYVENSWERK